MLFKDFAAGLKQLLKTQYLRSKSFESPTDIGSAREYFCHEFLSQFLPWSVVLTSGEVIDSYGHQTGQVDVVLYNEDLFAYHVTPKLHLLIVEGCFAAIEVKSTLNKQEFFDCLAKCQRFKALQPSLRPNLPETAHLLGRIPACGSFDNLAKPAMVRWSHEINRFIKPKFYIFGYSGPSDICTLTNWIKEYFADTPWPSYGIFPDLICILDTGVAYLDDGFVFIMRPSEEYAMRRLDPTRLYRFIQSDSGEVAALAFHILEAVSVSKKDSRLNAMEMSVYLRRYFDLALSLEPDAATQDQGETNAGKPRRRSR